MNLQETKSVIMGWVLSCETTEQIDLCHDAINEFIVKRFKDEPGMKEAETELRNATTTTHTQIIMKSGVWNEKPVSQKQYLTLN